MKARSSIRVGFRLGLFFVVTAIWAVGCGSEIGDSCGDNIDCSTTAQRICDKAQPGGYCTVQGCGATSCPDDSVCVAFYPASMLNVVCDPNTEDAVDLTVVATDDCRSDEICLSSGLCAQESLEQRFCMKPCSSDGDCRDEYECGVSGTGGAEAVPDPERVATKPAKFCRAKRAP